MMTVLFAGTAHNVQFMPLLDRSWRASSRPVARLSPVDAIYSAHLAATAGVVAVAANLPCTTFLASL